MKNEEQYCEYCGNEIVEAQHAAPTVKYRFCSTLCTEKYFEAHGTGGILSLPNQPVKPINSAHSFSEGSEYKPESKPDTAGSIENKIWRAYLNINAYSSNPSEYIDPFLRITKEYSDQQLAVFKENLKRSMVPFLNDGLLIPPKYIIDLIDQQLL